MHNFKSSKEVQPLHRNSSSLAVMIFHKKDEWGGANAQVGFGNGRAQVDVESVDVNLDLKRCLVDSVFGTDFGFRALPEVRAEVSELVNQLEVANPTPNLNEDPALLDDNWVLL